ncbi:MAG: hypothetical protein Fur0041_07590 [Bacteroidia bacterium]
MSWLLLSILFNSLLLLILKSFDRFRVQMLPGITVNYIVAGTLGMFFARDSSVNVIHSEWLPVAGILGTLFISIFFLIARTTVSIGVSVATVANKMSVVIPVALAVVMYDESLGLLKVTGMLIAVAAVYLTSIPSEKKGKAATNQYLLPLLVFIGSGIIDALVNHASKALVPSFEMPAFIGTAFISAFVIGCCIVTVGVISGRIRLSYREFLGGLILGVPNYFSIYCITRALKTGIFESSALYPVNNMGIVILSAVSALLLFREKLSLMNWAGILLSVVAISFITFS